MKPLSILAALVITGAASLPAYAGRDQAQILTQQQQERALAAAKDAQAQSSKGKLGAAGPAGVAGIEGEPGTQSLLLKRFHPRNAYGY
jgi:hypothetical protein